MVYLARADDSLVADSRLRMRVPCAWTHQRRTGLFHIRPAAADQDPMGDAGAATAWRSISGAGAGAGEGRRSSVALPGTGGPVVAALLFSHA
jgi:hypothetical protein